MKYEIEKLIKGIFNYDSVQVSFNKDLDAKPSKIFRAKVEVLESENGHCKFQFSLKMFGDEYYELRITNIPATVGSRHINVFFSAVMDYLTLFSKIFQDTKTNKNGRLLLDPNFSAICEIWLYNISKTILVEYIYELFNNVKEDYSKEQNLGPNLIRYDLDLINTIFSFATELSIFRIENKEIYCGFIFHDEIVDISSNSVRAIKIRKSFNFGEFDKIKKILEISNGQNVFFNVTNGKVTHFLITKEKINEIVLNPFSDGKKFQKRPLILSIQGTGKIHFLEGREDNNGTILQIINSRPVLRDNNFIKSYIIKSLKEWAIVDDEIIEVFSRWVMSLSQNRHGTSLIFCEMSAKIETKLIKTVKIDFNSDSYLMNSKKNCDISLLNSIVNPDGAVIFGSNLIPSHISTILPIAPNTKSTAGGARHNSVANFTRMYKCVGIVISDDGPITIFKNGKEQIKF